MRFALCALLCITVVSAGPRENFIQKVKDLVSNYLGANTPKAVDMIAADALALKSMEQMVTHLANEILGLVPASKYLQALGMVTTYTGCLTKCKSSLDKAADALGGAIMAQLTPMYNKVMNKIKTMQKNKKKQADILNEGFKIANTELTKKLVQSVINAAMTKSTKEEYACALPHMNTIMPTSQYNMVYDAKRG